MASWSDRERRAWILKIPEEKKRTLCSSKTIHDWLEKISTTCLIWWEAIEKNYALHKKSRLASCMGNLPDNKKVIIQILTFNPSGIGGRIFFHFLDTSFYTVANHYRRNFNFQWLRGLYQTITGHYIFIYIYIYIYFFLLCSELHTS